MAISDLLRTPTTLYQTPTTGAVVLKTVGADGSPVQPLTSPPPKQNMKSPISCFSNRHPSALSTAVLEILSTIDMSPAGRLPLVPGGWESALNFTKALMVKVDVFRRELLPTSMVGPLPSN